MKKKKDNPVPTFGILEWFRPGEYEEVKAAIADFKNLGITHLRTGISWADWFVPGTMEWYDWLLPELGKQVEILPCFLYTPPSWGEMPRTSAPPKELESFADFIDVMIDRYGDQFEWVELWNEPNNIVEYDFTLDSNWDKFSIMIGKAAYWAQQRGKKTALGGMSPIDPNWLRLMAQKGTLANIDAVGIHGFPDVFSQQWNGWAEKIISIRNVLKEFGLEKELWISEVGFSTWQHDEVKQYEELKKVLQTDVERVYWYSLRDLEPQIATVGGFHLDEREYHFGLRKADGGKKLLYRLLERGGVDALFEHKYVSKTYAFDSNTSFSLITGGAGFVGTNLADRLMKEGKTVMVYDNLSRDGVAENLQWLKKQARRETIDTDCRHSG